MNDDKILAGYAKELAGVTVPKMLDLGEVPPSELIQLLLDTEKQLDALGRTNSWENPQENDEGRDILAKREAIKYQINLSTTKETL